MATKSKWESNGTFSSHVGEVGIHEGVDKVENKKHVFELWNPLSDNRQEGDECGEVFARLYWWWEY